MGNSREGGVVIVIAYTKDKKLLMGRHPKILPRPNQIEEVCPVSIFR